MNMKLIEHKREQARYVCIERNAEMSGIQKKKNIANKALTFKCIKYRNHDVESTF